MRRIPALRQRYQEEAAAERCELHAVIDAGTLRETWDIKVETLYFQYAPHARHRKDCLPTTGSIAEKQWSSRIRT